MKFKTVRKRCPQVLPCYDFLLENKVSVFLKTKPLVSNLSLHGPVPTNKFTLLWIYSIWVVVLRVLATVFRHFPQRLDSICSVIGLFWVVDNTSDTLIPSITCGLTSTFHSSAEMNPCESQAALIIDNNSSSSTVSDCMEYKSLFVLESEYCDRFALNGCGSLTSKSLDLGSQVPSADVRLNWGMDLNYASVGICGGIQHGVHLIKNGKDQPWSGKEIDNGEFLSNYLEILLTTAPDAIAWKFDIRTTSLSLTYSA